MRKYPVKGHTHRLSLLLLLVQATRPFLGSDRNRGPQPGAATGGHSGGPWREPATDEYPRHLAQIHDVFGAL